ncbi:MAG: hydrogenase maturation nickel metallochaperone HypA [Desulfovibrio sp.]
MHEMSLIQSMMKIITEEMEKHEITALKCVTVKVGRLSGVVIDSLTFAWEALTETTQFKGVELKVIELPMLVSCGSCKEEFAPEDLYYMPCPKCGEVLGHDVLSGKEMYIENIEACDD